MIRFSCRCSHEFIVDDDQAGGLIQCPKCGVLNDIPTLSDVGNIEAGGIYKVGKHGPPPTPRVLQDSARAFTRDKQDARGEDIDLRLNLDEFLAIGSDEVPLALKDEVRPGAPKYDPVSGELIAPMDVKTEGHAIDPNSIPLASPALAYASGSTAKHISARRILLELFQPINALVMFFVLIAYVIAAFLAFPAMFFAALLGMPGFVLNIPIFLIIAHYGNVIDEIGVANADELPRPMRDLQLYDDLWLPFSRFIFALLACYWPLIAVSIMGPRLGELHEPTQLLLNLIGSFFFPAVLLTAITSGSILNLRPDRVLKVISISGGSYFLSVATWLLVQTLGVWSLAGPSMIPNFLLQKLMRLEVFNWYGTVVIVIFLSIYITHFFCWHLGLIYRAHHDGFPWVLQRHVKKPRQDAMSQLEARRAAIRRREVMQLAQANAKRGQVSGQVTITNVRKPADAPPQKEIWERVRDAADAPPEDLA